MLTDFQVIGGYGVPHPLHPVLLLGLDGIVAVGHVTVLDRIGEETLLLLCIINTEGGLQRQVLDRLQADEHVAEGTPVGVSVVLDAVEHFYRILTVRIAAGQVGKLAFRIIDRERGVVLQHIAEETARGRNLAGTVQREVLTDGQHVAKQLVVGIHTC